MNPPNNIQNGFFTPVSHFFSKVRKLTVFSHNLHTPIIPQSVRLRMERGRVIRAENPPFVPCSRRSACSACPLQFFGNKKNHMPDARGTCRAYDWGFDGGLLLPPSAGGGRSSFPADGGRSSPLHLPRMPTFIDPPPLFWWFRSFSAYMRWSARMRISAAAALSSG